MPSSVSPDVIHFGSFRFDVTAERLWDGSDPVTLRPKTWQVLRYLVENPGRVISKQELLDALWADVSVEEKAINTCIGEIRAALGDSSRHPRFVETVQRRGFRFLAATGAPAAQTSESVVSATFVGRRDELETLRLRLSAPAGELAMTVVAGVAGIGKSRLLGEAVQRSGTLALTGQCVEGGGLPYLPWVEMIRGHLRERPAFDWRAALGGAIAELERLIPALQIAAAPAPPSTDPELARLRLFEAIASFFETASRSEPLVLVLEDIHWIDSASLRALQALLPRLAAARAHVLATLREEDAAAGSPVRVALDTLHRRRLVEIVEVRGLPAAETRELIGSIGGAALADDVIDKIANGSEGSPFFVEELLRHYASGQVLDAGAAASAELFLPANVVEVFDRRRRRLSAMAQNLIEAMAVAGNECDEPLLEDVLRVSDDDLLAAINEAIEQKILRENPHRPGRYGFVHALMALAIAQRLTPPLRRRWHRQLAEAAIATRSDAGTRIAEVAHHLARAVPAVPVERAVAALREAAEHAAANLAYEDAIEHCAKALELARGPQGGAETRACLPELAVRHAEALQKVGDAERADKAFREAAELARDPGDVEWFARAALGMATIWEFEAPDLREYIEEALRRLGDAQPALRARLLARLAVVLYPLAGTRRRCEELSSQAAAAARTVGDPTLLAQTLVDWLAGQWYQDNIAAQEAVSEELIEVARRSADGALLATAHGWRAVIGLCAGDVERAGREAGILLDLAPRLGQPLYHWCAFYLSATLALLHGDLERAESFAGQAFEHGRNASPRSATIVYFTQMVTVRREQGRIAEIILLLEQNPSRMSSDALVWNLPHFYLEADRLDEGRAAFERVCALGFAAMPGENSRNRRLMTLGAMGLACATLDDKRVAASLYPILLPDAQCWAVAGWGAVSYGVLDSAAGALATCLGNYDAATMHFERAIAEYECKRTRIALARAYYLYADMLLRRRARGDAPRADRLLAKATALCDELGLVRVRTLIDRLRARR